MEKKITVKDVAKEAGVSIATVSYIMNNRTDIKISEKTRKKVLQIANLMHYIPSSAAKSLVTGKNNIIAIACHLSDSPSSRLLETTEFIDLLTERLNHLNYSVLLLPVKSFEDPTRISKNIDGIIAIDLTQQEFLVLSDNSMVPIVTVDTPIDDVLFYQVCSDYPSLFQKLVTPESILVLDSYHNDAYMNFLLADLPTQNVCICPEADINSIHKLQGKKLIIVGCYLAQVLAPYLNSTDITVISSKENLMLPESYHIQKIDITKKADVAISLLIQTIEQNFMKEHNYKVELL